MLHFFSRRLLFVRVLTNTKTNTRPERYRIIIPALLKAESRPPAWKKWSAQQFKDAAQDLLAKLVALKGLEGLAKIQTGRTMMLCVRLGGGGVCVRGCVARCDFSRVWVWVCVGGVLFLMCVWVCF